MVAWALTACVAVEPSGQPFAPVAVVDEVEAPSQPSAPPGPPSASAPAEPSGFDFEGEARPEPDAVPPAAGAVSEVVEAVVAAPSPDPTPVEDPPVAPVWDPSKPLVDASFGVRVVATLLDLQPPRAVLGLPDGREEVVRPGAMLEEHGLVVLAIGRDAVQIAKITPEGFHASVQTQTVQALYPSGRATVAD